MLTSEAPKSLEKMSDLAKCPFCGNAVEKNSEGDIDCPACAYTFYDTSSGNQWWNWRPIEDRLQTALTQAINVNTEMARERDILREELEQERNGTKALMLLVDTVKLATDIAMAAALDQKTKLDLAYARIEKLLNALFEKGQP